MGWYRARPDLVEAHQLGAIQATDICRWMTDRGGNAVITVHANSHVGLEIHTLEGVAVANPGDWIVRGLTGEFFRCAPDVFDVTYEKARAL